MNLDCDTQDCSFEDEKKTAILPSELLRYVSIDRLYKNAQNYPEMSVKLTEIQKEMVKKIKEVLMQIPLIHGTPKEQIAMGFSDIFPLDELPPDPYSNSLESDRSLGLTKCVFFNWGMAEKRYGRFIIQFSPNLLDKENVFVTPMDIGEIQFADDCPFEKLEPKRKKRIDKYYFNNMVTGKTWKEIIARRILKTIELGQSFFPLSKSGSLGEIKHYGIVNAKDFIGSFPVSDIRAHYRYLYEHGFAFTNMEEQRKLYQETGKKYGVDPTYEECNINYKKACTFWEKTLGLK